MTNTDTLKVTTPTDREIVITRGFNAPRTLVWDAMTRPELLKRWLSGPPGWSMVGCEVDLKVGGAFRHVWSGPNGASMGMGGVHREIVPLERIVRTELFDEDWTGGETLATAAFTEQGGRTTLSITVLYSSRAARDGALATGMTEGMAAGFDQLAELLASTPARMDSQGGPR